jgi:hypothetical protein
MISPYSMVAKLIKRFPYESCLAFFMEGASSLSFIPSSKGRQCPYRTLPSFSYIEFNLTCSEAIGTIRESNSTLYQPLQTLTEDLHHVHPAEQFSDSYGIRK